MQTARWQRGRLSWLTLLLGLQLPGMALSPGEFLSLSLVGLASPEPVTNPAAATAGDPEGFATGFLPGRGRGGCNHQGKSPLP